METNGSNDVNRLKGLKLKFDVTDNPELSKAIQKRLVELGASGKVRDFKQPFIFYGSDGDIEEQYFASYVTERNENLIHDWKRNHILSTLNDLYHLPKTHTITIDGKDIELSAESFAELKAQLT